MNVQNVLLAILCCINVVMASDNSILSVFNVIDENLCDTESMSKKSSNLANEGNEYAICYLNQYLNPCLLTNSEYKQQKIYNNTDASISAGDIAQYNLLSLYSKIKNSYCSLDTFNNFEKLANYVISNCIQPSCHLGENTDVEITNQQMLDDVMTRKQEMLALIERYNKIIGE